MASKIDKPAGLLEPEAMAALMDTMRARGVVAFRVRSGDEELEVRWPEPQQVPALAPTDQPPVVEAPTPTQTLHAITSPSVGTYFASPEPGKPAFVELGQRVTPGEVVCVVESMKLMNEIEADTVGVVVELPIQNGGSVKAGEVVCLLRLDDDR
jgi:acetyl-CoA carboxylase biotin carboxyl carrier protein